MDEHKIELLLARTERHDKMLEDHSDRLIKLEEQYLLKFPCL